MVRADDWFDEWQQGFYSTPDGLSHETYQKLYAKCEDWARKKKLYDDTKNSDAMDLSNVNAGYNSDDSTNASWNVSGWVDDDGYFYPDNGSGSADWIGGGEGDDYEQEVDPVNKGKGKGPKCFNCDEYGRIAANCKKPKRFTKGKGKGGGSKRRR